MKMAAVFLLLLAGCSGSYSYQPLAGYAFKQGHIEKGSEVQLVAFSGTGREAAKDEALYYQFIVSQGGKTYRVLAPAIQFRTEGGTYIYTDPGSLEKDKTQLTA
ncbi:MAG: hypothetical protein EOP50_10970, partial [Sphingobacteriales bacterium]